MRTRLRSTLVGTLLTAGLALACGGKGNSAKRSEVGGRSDGPQGTSKSSRTLIGLQYESYFTKHNVSWDASQPSGSVGLHSGTEETVPILGKYSSYDVSVMKKHEEWFEDLGINWLLLDWTNFLMWNGLGSDHYHRGDAWIGERSTNWLARAG